MTDVDSDREKMNGRDKLVQDVLGAEMRGLAMQVPTGD